MKGETRTWLLFAEENLASARLLLANSLFNPCLQNIQQSVEKHLKALLVERAVPVRKTHSINELVAALAQLGVSVGLAETDCDLLDTIYLPSKYPLGSALPDFSPDAGLCRQCLDLAEGVAARTRALLV